ncbi:hypothetical protein HN51_070307 [Arachis hypogaea]|uniref:CASP-like protein 4A3 n=1 Tax=Arachis ipaensis TaxID=130454 RepID=UPI0007AF31FB|nr:CASP-like protein 4A3 [Arachis ipaensis]XP_025655307.1 CASP-like protein 4A3 isoform X1 [Arachis hypogaea]QHO12675.1 CASP-like protein [Arachis hypogaea]
MNKSLSKNSESSNKFESPVPFHTSPRWDAANTQGSPIYWSSEESPAKPFDNSKAIVAVDKFTQYTPEKSTRRQNPPHHSPAVPAPPPPPVMPPQRESKGEWRREEALRKAALGFRVSEVVVCLISFSVMASDRTQGWSGDSFDRYKEYRYCLSVNIIAFAYAGLQAFDLVYQLVTGKHMINHHLRSHFDFFVDQVLAYLLISASSCAATRVDDWQSNWGKDEFTEMASASISMAFLGFVAFAISSLISGYILCTRSSM